MAVIRLAGRFPAARGLTAGHRRRARLSLVPGTRRAALLRFALGALIVVAFSAATTAVAGLLQFIPNFGGPIAVIIPAVLGALSSDHMRFFYVLILFAIIMVTDGLLLQPYFMKRTARVPFWASLFTPILVALLIPFWWAILLAPPLLAIIFAFRQKRTAP